MKLYIASTPAVLAEFPATPYFDPAAHHVEGLNGFINAVSGGKYLVRAEAVWCKKTLPAGAVTTELNKLLASDKPEHTSLSKRELRELATTIIERRTPFSYRHYPLYVLHRNATTYFIVIGAPAAVAEAIANYAARRGTGMEPALRVHSHLALREALARDNTLTSFGNSGWRRAGSEIWTCEQTGRRVEFARTPDAQDIESSLCASGGTHGGHALYVSGDWHHDGMGCILRSTGAHTTWDFRSFGDLEYYWRDHKVDLVRYRQADWSVDAPILESSLHDILDLVGELEDEEEHEA